MLRQDALDRIGERLDGSTSACTGRGNEDQPSVRLASGKPFSRERTEILHIVRDYGAALDRSHREDRSIALAGQVATGGHGLNVMTTAAEQLSYQRRELLIEQSLHPRIARSPAAAASNPRWYSDSLSSISVSISPRYSP